MTLPTPILTRSRAPLVRTTLLGALLLAAQQLAAAQSLGVILEAARGYDAGFLAAQAQRQADLALAEQAKAGLRPQVGLSAGASWARSDNSVAANHAHSDSQNLSISASQPLYRPVNALNIEQAERALEASEATLRAAEQDLIVRTSRAYFEVLAAQDTLTFVQAQKAAVTQQLEAAKRNFEVGTSTITDAREAQARYDLVLAQEIAAENTLRVNKLALDQLVGRADLSPWPLRNPVDLPALQPATLDDWLKRSESAHPTLTQALIGLDIARLETQKAQAGHRPTLDAVASYTVSRAPSSVVAGDVRSNNASIGLQLNWPLFAGYAIQNRVKETVALQTKAENDLDGARRAVTQATRSAYYGVLSGLGQVKALEAAEASSQSALEANQLGYEVGVRINIDVLNAQSQLFQTKRDLAKARYDVLLGGLQLRQASGVLSAEDVGPIDALVTPPTN